MAKGRSITSVKQPKARFVVLDSINLGGVADSPYMGGRNSVFSCVGFDLHSVPGLIQSSQALKLYTATSITDLVKLVPCSDGNVYAFGKTSGTVWKIDSSGTVTSLGTVSPAAGSAGILDAYQFNGKIYYAMQSRLGQWDFTGAFSGRNDNFATFTNGSTTNHPMFYLLNNLYIGDGVNLAVVDKNNTFTANGLTFTIPIRIDCLGKTGSDILVGASPTDQTTTSHVFDWNTWSAQTNNDYIIPETQINAILTSEVGIIANAGLAGKLYEFKNGQFQMSKQIPSKFPTQYSNSNQAQVYYPAVTKFNGISVFAMSSISNDPCYEGIWSWGSAGGSYPNILSMPFVISTGNLSKVKIWSLAVRGTDILVSWQDNTTGSAVYGVDIIDWSNKYNGSFLETRLLKSSRIYLDYYKKFVVNYQNLPANTQIKVFYDANWAGYVQYDPTATDPLEIVTDTDRNLVNCFLQPQAKTMRFKVQTTASGNNAPLIEDLVISPD